MADKNTYVRALAWEEESDGKLVRQKVITEVVEDYVDVKLPKKHRINNGAFITVFQSALMAIVKHGNLSKNEHRLLLWLLASAGIDGSIETNLDILRDELNTDKGNISRALKGLVEKNIVIRKNHNRYSRSALPIELSLSYDQLNYNLAYNGRHKEFINKRNSHPAIEVKDEEGNWVPITQGVDYSQLSIGQGVDMFTGEVFDISSDEESQLK